MIMCGLTCRPRRRTPALSTAASACRSPRTAEPEGMKEYCVFSAFSNSIQLVKNSWEVMLCYCARMNAATFAPFHSSQIFEHALALQLQNDFRSAANDVRAIQEIVKRRIVLQCRRPKIA